MRRAQSGCSGFASPDLVNAFSDLGTTVNAQRVPVNPPFLEKLRLALRGCAVEYVQAAQTESDYRRHPRYLLIRSELFIAD